MADLSLAVLGPFQASLGTAPLPGFRTLKVQALLVYLAIEPDSHSRDSLMTLLWPGLPERSARGNLRQIIYYLRKTIPEVTSKVSRKNDLVPLFIANRSTIQLNPAAAVGVDAHHFESFLQSSQNHSHLDLLACRDCCCQLEKAIGLYRGDFLEDFYLDDSNEFEEWAQALREAYRRKALDALEVLTTMSIHQREYPQARAYAEQQLEIDDLRESAYRQLMEVMALGGQRADALAVYERCRRHLAEELGMAPAKRTTEVYERILAGELNFNTFLSEGVRGYELKDELGEGAYGTIHRAVQPNVGREVAVKVVRRRYANDPEFIRRFEAEAQIIARLEHPHIVPLYDYWRDPDGAYLVMRYLRGGNLLSALESGPWDPGRAGQLLDQIACALTVAHRQGVVHRDIKPANILFDEAGNAYLSDFGIAKDLTGEMQMTGSGAVIGTPDYISPEQILNDPVTPQSDIYSLGAVLYETLTGEKPFPDSSVANLIYKHLHERVPQVSASRPDLPAQIDEVIQRATAKSPADRYADALEMAEAFRKAVMGSAADRMIFDFPTRAEIVELYNPYKGLRAFQEADADDFFGRDALVEQLLAQLSPALDGRSRNGRGSRFLAVVGPSGSGKSSVVKAGLIPALRDGALPGSDKWFMAEMVPGTHPLEELELALWPIAVDPPPSLVEPMQRDTRGMLRTIRRVLPDEPGTQFLLVIDQFEELFTLVDDERRKFFLDSLLAALRAPRSPLWVVITLRADFYDRPLQYESLGRLVKENSAIVLPLTAEELTWAVCEPARRVGVTLERGLESKIITDVAEQPGALPLMQYALTELFENRQDNGQAGMMTRAVYEEIGGVLGALGRRAEEIFGDLNPAGQEATRQLFLRQVTLGEGVEDTRRRVLRTELEAVQTSGVSETSEVLQTSRVLKAPDISLVIDTFGAARLLTFDRDPSTRQPTVEVAHEALLREWGRLRGWLDESRNDVRLQRLLAQAAAEWLKTGKDPGYLLRQSRLDQFSSWAESSSIALTQDEREFLETSIAARKARQAEEEARRQHELETAQQLAETEKARAEEQAEAAGRLRRRAIYLIVALVLAVALAVTAGLLARRAESERQNSQRQAAILLASQAESDLAAGYHDRAVLLAMEALEENPYTTQAERALGRAVSYNRALQVCPGFDSAAVGVDWSPDGQRIAAIASADNQVKVWDAAACPELLAIDLPQGITDNLLDMGLSVKWTPDGERLLTVTGDRYLVGSQDYDLILWDAESGEQVATVEIANLAEPELPGATSSGTHYPAVAADFAPGNGRLATIGGDNTAIVWDEAYQAPEIILTGHEDDVNSVAWSPDGKYLATASLDGTARIWDGQNGHELMLLQGHSDRVNQSTWSPNGDLLATGGFDGRACIWDAADGQLLQCLDGHAGPVWSLAWLNDNTRLVTGHEDAAIRIWDSQTGELLETLRGHEGLISHVALSPAGDKLASSGGSGQVRLWNVAASTTEQSLPYESLNGYLDITQDGRYAALPTGDSFFLTEKPALVIWDLAASQQVVEELTPDVKNYWLSLQYSPDEQMLLAIGSGEFPNFDPLSTAYAFETSSGDTLQTFNIDDENYLRSIAISPDGSLVAAGRFFFGEIIVWDFQTGAVIAQLRPDNPEQFNMVNSVQWSADGSQLAAAYDDSTARVWNTSTWELLTEVHHEAPAYVWNVRWSPDGKRLLTAAGNDETGAEDTTARVWDGETGELLQVLRGHTGQIASADWSPDGRRIATVSADGTTRVWDADTGEELLSLSTPNLFIGYLAWSPDGQHLVVGGHGLPPAVWRVWQNTEELVDYTRECCLFRELTPEERIQFGLGS